MINKLALLKMGYTQPLIEAILGQPDKVEHHGKGFRRWTVHLYFPSRAEAGMKDPRFLAVAAKRQRRELLARERKAAIPTKYATWQAALPGACEGMFSLNRYAKHRTCSALHRVEIYRLKGELIELLWRNGYCTASWLHVLPALACRHCDGGDPDCDCGGTGEYRGPQALWCFRFSVAGKVYCWHQPKSLVGFTPEESLPPQEWQGLSGVEKSVCLDKRRFGLAKELIGWVLSRAGEPVEEVVEMLPFEEALRDVRPCVLEQWSLFDGGMAA